MTKLVKVLAIAVVVGMGLAPFSPASATLNLFYSQQNAALSIDGATEQTPLQTSVPVGATVLNAFLYVADVFGSNPTPTGSVTLAGNVLNLSTFTKLTPNENSANTYRLDVTSIMKPIIEGTGGLQTHTYTEQATMDGAVLVVAYRNASTTGTAIILDGELAQAGDSTTLTFGAPYAGGDVIMSLASSFSFQPTGQVTTVDIVTSSHATRRLSGCAGGQDDGFAADGGLITVGGIGDSTSNPNPACSGASGPTANDDELYNLALGNSANSDPFLSAGDTSVTFNTTNPSFDDNVFALFFTSSFGVTQVDDVSIDEGGSAEDVGGVPTPAPATLIILGAGLVIGAVARRRSR